MENLTVLLAAATSFLLLTQLVQWKIFYWIKILFEFLFLSVPKIKVETTELESKDDLSTAPSASIDIKNPKRPGLIQCFDPSTRQHLGEVKAMTKAEVGEVCEKAAKAQVSWSKTTYTQRRIVLRTLQKYVLDNMETISRVCTRDSGKPQVDAVLGEILTTCEKIRCINHWGELWLQPDYRPTSYIMAHKTAYVEYVPYGVLGVISPWNYPFHNFTNHIISGLFSGNAVVAKVSEHTSWSSTYCIDMVRAALAAHGHDVDVVQTVTGFGEAGAALVDHPKIDKIIFTGSPKIGRLVMEGCSKHVKPVVLELGGKDPMILCEDAKMNEIIPWVLRGCFQNCGQNCIGVERVFVYESIFDEFIDRVTPKVKALRQGIPLKTCGSNGSVDLGSLVMEQHSDYLQGLIDDAVKKGATLHCGGKRNSSLKGNFYEPTMISGITSEMRIANEEVFGPVMCIMKVPNDSDDECVRMVNESCFGLGSCAYSENKARALAIGKKLKSGMFMVNDFGGNYLIQSLPFGGVKESGFNRFAGIEGLRACCLERSIVVDRFPFVKTQIPPPIDYPMSEKGSLFADSIVHLMYEESIFSKIMAIINLIKSSA